MREDQKIILAVGLTLVLCVPLTAIAVQLTGISQVVKDKESTNISEYLKQQDKKIEALQKSGDDKSIRIDQLDKQRAEEIETWQLALDAMTEKELQAFWDKWAIEVCPKYEQDWYCKGDN